MRENLNRKKIERLIDTKLPNSGTKRTACEYIWCASASAHVCNIQITRRLTHNTQLLIDFELKVIMSYL